AAKLRMSVSSMVENQSPDGPRRLTVIGLLVLLLTMVFVQLFVTFRGLSSPAAMDSAQLARELTLGHGFHTKVVRPSSWRQHLAKVGDDPVASLREVAQPPLPALVLAPIFGLLHRHYAYKGQTRVYLLDRVTATVAIFFFLGALGVTYVTARRLFDAWVAGWMVLCVLLCQFAWDVARSGLAPAMAMFFVALALNALAAALERNADGERATLGQALTVGLACALLVVTHGLAAWVVPGLALAWAIWVRQRWLLFVVLLLPAMTVGGWAWWQMSVAHEPFSAARTVLQAALAYGSDAWLWRDFSGATPPVDLATLALKSLGNLIEQCRNFPALYGGAVPALLFLPALLHPFRKVETRAFRWALLVTWLGAVLGMAIVGLPEMELDDRQVHFLFLPLFAAFGFAFLAIFWARLFGQRTHWWARHGAAAVATVLSAMPMLHTLPNEMAFGLSTTDRMAHWPPYLPDRIAKLRTFTAEDEVIFSDVPWAVAWYADRRAVWLPLRLEDLAAMREQLRKHGESSAGILITPLSAKGKVPGDVFRDSYANWSPLVFRGYGLGLGVDTLSALPDFPFREFLPMAGQPVGDRFIAEMAFFSDRRRW
ncbi:MAG: hypothetical protein ACOYMN_10730, partial [Roseimicrobium sp.]